MYVPSFTQNTPLLLKLLSILPIVCSNNSQQLLWLAAMAACDKENKCFFIVISFNHILHQILSSPSVIYSINYCHFLQSSLILHQSLSSPSIMYCINHCHFLQSYIASIIVISFNHIFHQILASPSIIYCINYCHFLQSYIPSNIVISFSLILHKLL